MVKIKTTKELIEEKENMIKEYDQKIYESVQRAGIKSRAEGAKRRAELQELEDKGWYRLHTIETPIVVEPEPMKQGVMYRIEDEFIEGYKEEEPEPEPVIDPEKEALKAQLEETKEQLRLLEAAKDMEEPDEVEIEPDIPQQKAE